MLIATGCYAGDMDENTRVEIELKLAQAQLATAMALLAVRNARWDELVIVGGTGITLGPGIAPVFLRQTALTIAPIGARRDRRTARLIGEGFGIVAVQVEQARVQRVIVVQPLLEPVVGLPELC